MDSFEQNKIAGWFLASAVLILGLSIFSGIVFEQRPLKPGEKYKVEGVVEEATAAAPVEKPIAFFLAAADPAKGEAQFKKCTSCHNVAKGGANGIGPNLWGVVGRDVGKHPGYAYSDAVAGHGGKWDWDAISHWLTNPKTYIAGNKMAFGGIGKPEDRADLIAYLNTQSDAPLPKPAAPAEAAADAGGGDAAAGGKPGEAAAPGAAEGAKPAPAAAITAAKTSAPAPGKAPDVTADKNPAATARQPVGNRGGDGAVDVTGQAKRDKN